MKPNELNKLRYSFQSDGKEICNNYTKTLMLVSRGESGTARKLFQETDGKLQALKERQQNYEEHFHPHVAKEQKNSIEFIDVLRDSIRQATYVEGKDCPIRYHIYA